MAKKKASDQREKDLHESMQQVSESSVEFSILSIYLATVSFVERCIIPICWHMTSILLVQMGPILTFYSAIHAATPIIILFFCQRNMEAIRVLLLRQATHKAARRRVREQQ